MRRTVALVALLLSASLGAACPIPQTVPEYPKGSPITPPRIVAESAVPQAPLVRVPNHCGSVAPWFIDLSASLVDEDIAEPVEARWFVDYVPDPADERVAIRSSDVIGPIDQVDEDRPDTSRPIPPFRFYPYGHQPPLQQSGLFASNTDPGVLHVVELVISNGFAPDPAPPAAPLAAPYRTPLEDFETQVHRWTFLIVDDPALPCPPDAPIP